LYYKIKKIKTTVYSNPMVEGNLLPEDEDWMEEDPIPLERLLGLPLVFRIGGLTDEFNEDKDNEEEQVRELPWNELPTI
jgi:hypothetical protein